MISHDRELLNNSVDAILHLNTGKLDLYPAATTISSTAAPRRRGCRPATRAKQDAERAHLQKFIDRFRAKASKATQAQSRIKRLAKLPPIAAIGRRERPGAIYPALPRAPPGAAADPA